MPRRPLPAAGTAGCAEPCARTSTSSPAPRAPYSYPSRHAARSAAAVTFLSALSPHRAGEYEWMRAQVLYSRLYMAGHVTSDLTAGTLLGDLIGDYELAISGH
ncbi:phosphatase PAP2 family protein [Streptomyces sp. NPDC002078]